MSDHSNSYNKRGPVRVDVARLPDHIKAATTAPIPMRPGEIHCISAITSNKAGTRPLSRAYSVVTQTPGRPPMVTVQISESTGHATLANLQIGMEELEPLLVRLITIYKRAGGKLAPLLAAYESINNE